MPQVLFKNPKFKALEVSSNTPLLKQLQSNGIPIASSCGGEGTCNKCVIEVLEGEQNLSPENPIEAQLKNKFGLKSNQRISCQVLVLGPIKITTSYW